MKLGSSNFLKVATIRNVVLTCNILAKGEPCQAGEFQCKSDKRCIEIANRCDGKADCGDGSDEDGCRE